MKIMNEWKIAVIGVGTMGTNIAFCFAVNGYEVNIYDVNPEVLKRALVRMENNLYTMGALDGVSDKRVEEVLSRVHTFTDMESAVKDVDFVMEAVFENPEVKRNTFAEVSKYCRPDTILGSNTSTLNIFEFVEVDHPERLAVVHFGGPAHIMKVVEIVKGPNTSDDTMQKCCEMMKTIGKVPVSLSEAVPGFILNRMFATTCREAAYLVGNGWAMPAEIEKAVVSAFGPLCALEGFFKTADASGLQNMLAKAEVLSDEICSSTTYSAEFYKKLRAEGKLGVKNGKGFFDYPDIDEALVERDYLILQSTMRIDEARAAMDEKIKEVK